MAMVVGLMAVLYHATPAVLQVKSNRLDILLSKEQNVNFGERRFKFRMGLLFSLNILGDPS